MRAPELRTQLQQCAARPFRVTDFSIGHRGAALQYPEHTKESHEAAARMGAGIIECDVTFTGDAQLVCRHAQCDLATTTNVLVTDLAGKCSEPFIPAEFDPKTGALTKPASAKCCTSDFSLAEFKTLCGKMDASNPAAKMPLEFLGGHPNVAHRAAGDLSGADEPDAQSRRRLHRHVAHPQGKHRAHRRHGRSFFSSAGASR